MIDVFNAFETGVSGGRLNVWRFQLPGMLGMSAIVVIMINSRRNTMEF
jgi:hypothetical protein